MNHNVLSFSPYSIHLITSINSTSLAKVHVFAELIVCIEGTFMCREQCLQTAELHHFCGGETQDRVHYFHPRVR